MEKVAFFENQVRQLEQQLRVKEEEKKKEVEILKDFYQKKLDENKNSDSTVSHEKQKLWEQEKTFL